MPTTFSAIRIGDGEEVKETLSSKSQDATAAGDSRAIHRGAGRFLPEMLVQSLTSTTFPLSRPEKPTGPVARAGGILIKAFLGFAS